MKYTIVSRKATRTKRWSGGTTRELFIYPEGSSYEKRDFKFRLSTATIEDEKSTFTALPGVSRTLMVLSGNITLKHKGQHSSTLIRGDIDRFQGSWETSSTGMCRDLNLMTQGRVSGSMHSLFVNAGEQTDLTLNRSFSGIYLAEGKLRILQPEVVLHQDEFILFEGYSGKLILHGEDDAFLALIEISL